MRDPQGTWYLIKFCPNDLGPKYSPPFLLPVLPRAGGCGYPRGGCRSEKELEDPHPRRKQGLLTAPGLSHPFLPTFLAATPQRRTHCPRPKPCGDDPDLTPAPRSRPSLWDRVYREDRGTGNPLSFSTLFRRPTGVPDT